MAAVLAAARVLWNATHPHDLFIDSWVLVHVLEVAGRETERLPRGMLTLLYPLSYLPFLPVAKLVGALPTVGLVYPIVASLAAVPASLITRGGPAPIAGVAAMLLLPDLAVKALTGTPQAVALPLFVLALFLALSGRRWACWCS